MSATFCICYYVSALNGSRNEEVVDQATYIFPIYSLKEGGRQL